MSYPYQPNQAAPPTIGQQQNYPPPSNFGPPQQFGTQPPYGQYAQAPYAQNSTSHGQPPYGQNQGQSQSPIGQTQPLAPHGQQGPSSYGQTPYVQGQPAYGQVQAPYGQHQAPYGQHQTPYGQQQAPYVQQHAPYGQQQTPYGQQSQAPYGQSQAPHGQIQLSAPYGQQGHQSQPAQNNSMIMQGGRPMHGGQFQHQVLGQKEYNTFDLSTTNMALFGSDLEKKIKLAASQGENAWINCGKAAGIQIWRIENFKVIHWPKQHYGTFYSGDSYIVLHTYQKPSNPKLLWDIHFWIGKNSTQDEYGTAAYKTVELDDFLGGGPVQHREIQDHESQRFLSYFPRITFMHGGVESGFNKVKLEKQQELQQEKQTRRLLHVSGKKNVVVRECPLQISSLNSGDCFILDFGLNIYLMNGKKANIMEKNKAGQTCQELKSERKISMKLEVDIHSFTEGETTEDAIKFWSVFGQCPTPAIAPSSPDVDTHAGGLKMYKISDESGTLRQTNIHVPAQRKDAFGLLQAQDAFLIDTGNHIYIWIGCGASQMERRSAISMATQHLFSQQLPLYTPLTSVFQGTENDDFFKVFGIVK